MHVAAPLHLGVRPVIFLFGAVACLPLVYNPDLTPQVPSTLAYKPCLQQLASTPAGLLFPPHRPELFGSHSSPLNAKTRTCSLFSS